MAPQLVATEDATSDEIGVFLCTLTFHGSGVRFLQDQMIFVSPQTVRKSADGSC
jgi:hypothetical protein